MTGDRNSKTMSFYATPTDQDNIEEIQEMCPHYSFNFIVREGMRFLLRSLQSSNSVPPPPSRKVEYNIP